MKIFVSNAETTLRNLLSSIIYTAFGFLAVMTVKHKTLLRLRCYIPMTVDLASKRFLQFQLIWVGISLAISVGISLIVPFPFSIVVIIAVFLFINYYIRKRQLRQMGLGTGGGFSSIFGQQRGVSYYCMNCGTRHNQKSCPNCGSKLKRVGFEE